MINRKIESLQEKSISSLEKIQWIYKDSLQILRKELKSKNLIISKLLETRGNISNKAVQPNPQQSHNFTLKMTQMIQTNLRENRSEYQKSIVQIFIDSKILS